MAKKKSNNSAPNIIAAVAIVVIGFIIYAVTGVDFLGITGTNGNNTANPTTVVNNGGNTTTQIPTIAAPTASGNVQTISVGLGFGYQSSFWQVYFTSPSNTRDRSQYVNGVDVQLAAAIDATRNTLDIAAFEMNNEVITAAIERAHDRGVRVRMVVDDEHGIEDDDSTLVELELAGIDIVNDNRSALMHNKFMIMDSTTVWMGSMNYTVNGVYRNNNNVLVMRSQRAVQTYQAEFDEMFVRGQFGPRSDASNTASFSQDGVPIEIYFASENNVVTFINREITAAQSSVRFMAFSFTRDDMGQGILARANAGVTVEGIFETTGSQTQYSEMGLLFCAGLDVRQDGNSGVMHHKVIIIDDSIVLTGSFNFSDNAVNSNDENLVIIRSRDIASLYVQEFRRVQSIATRPNVACN